MSFDALVWLLVGLGIGVAGSLMALMLYAALEGGRLRRARQAKPISVKVEKPAPAMARPPVAPTVAPKAVEPLAAPVVAVPAATVVETVAAEPVPAPVPPPEPAAPKPVQSVEALFAEAFAIDRLSPAPKPEDERS